MSSLGHGDHEAWNAWGLGCPLRVTKPPTGTVNRTLLIECDAGSFVLRISRRERARIEWEHTALHFAAENGIPVCIPIPTPNGNAVVKQGASLYTLLPRAQGVQVARADLEVRHAASAGRCLAAIHKAFQLFPMERARPKALGCDISSALANIPKIEAAIRALPECTEKEDWALTRLSGRRTWLERNIDLGAEVSERMAALPKTVLHGDFQETNLFFDTSDQVSSIIDWDQSGVAIRGWDIVRALDLMFSVDPMRCSAFLQAYRDVLPISDRELQETAFCYGVLAAANLWVYEASYLDRDDRVKQFIYPGEFQPFHDRWRAAGL